MAALTLLPPALMVPAALAADGDKAGQSGKAVRLDDFERTYAPGELYANWQIQKIAPFFGSGSDQFVQFFHQGKEHYIHLRSGANDSYSLGRRDGFRVQDWPILEWEWKVTRTPSKGDVRVTALDDQAGSICLIVNPGLMGFDSLCYLWENGGPKDTPLTSTKRDASRYLILRTVEQDGLGTWYAERRNLLADYTRVFGHPPEQEAVIGMQIDSDSTASAGEVFYRNLYRRRP